MKRRSSGTPRKPAPGARPRGNSARTVTIGALGAVAAGALFAGLAVSAPSAPSTPQAPDSQPAASTELGAGVLLGGNGTQTAVNTPLAPNAAAQQVAPAPNAAAPQLAQQQPAAPGASAAPIAELQRARAAFQTASAKASAPGPRPDLDPDSRPPMPDFTGAAVGSALGELQGRFDEFAQNQWVQTGSVKVTGSERVEVVKIAGVPTQRFSTCIDSSAIEIRDVAGSVVLAAAPAGTRTALNMYDIQQQKGTWVVVAHSFPNSAAC